MGHHSLVGKRLRQVGFPLSWVLLLVYLLSTLHETIPLLLALKAGVLLQGSVAKGMWRTGSTLSWLLLVILLIYRPPETNSVILTILKVGLLFRCQHGAFAKQFRLPKVGSTILWVLLFAALYSYLQEITQVFPVVAALKAWLLFFHLERGLGVNGEKPPPTRDKVPTIPAPNSWLPTTDSATDH